MGAACQYDRILDRVRGGILISGKDIRQCKKKEDAETCWLFGSQCQQVAGVYAKQGKQREEDPSLNKSTKGTA